MALHAITVFGIKSLGHKYPCECRTNDFLPLRKWSKIVRTAFVRVFVTNALGIKMKP